MDKKRILYVMHIDWRWIKQRPHFIAEGLSDFYDITVVHFCSKRYLFRNSDASTTNEKNLSILPAYRLPLYQNKVVYSINRVYMQLYFKLLIKRYNPDFIWITFPQLYDYIPSNTGCKIIYDCMDDAIGFDFQDFFKSKIVKLEKKLIEDASVIFASSNYLFKSLNENYQCNDKLILVRNALGGKIINNTPNDSKMQDRFKIGYVGTISQWIDFEKIKITLNKIKNIEYHFIGPYELENIELKQHDRVKFYGPINYDELYDYVKSFDCLIVPFKVDNKIKSADPGKLYGYINYNKPIISVYYDELEYFSPFIYFYSNAEELIDLLKQMIKNGFTQKYPDLERIEFLKSNSWDKRLNKILKYLNDL